MGSSKEFYDFARDFMDCNPDKQKVDAPRSTDKPLIKMFMFQLVNAYSKLTDKEGMRWLQNFKHKGNNKHYRVTITLEEIDV